MTDQHDAVVVGASIAGCTVAALLARQGARVALVDRRPDPAAYKVVCTHYVQADGIPVLERLGVLDELKAAGAVSNRLRSWTRFGWIDTSDEEPTGLSVTRRRLDPVLREAAASTPGVDLRLGATVCALIEEGGRVEGVRVRSRDGGERSLHARLVVAADGRGSTVASLARVPARVRPHGRIGYMGYFAGLPREERPVARLWLRDPDVSYLFPNEDGLTVLACFVGHEHLPAFRRDPDAAFAAQFRGLPDAPDLASAERVSAKLIGKVDMPNTYRLGSRAGLAFTGDAMMAADPLWGVGCGFALTSAGLLADAVGPELVATGGDVERGLRRYRARHRRRFIPQHLMLSDYATGRAFNPFERALFRAAARDAQVASGVHLLGNRVRSPLRGMTPAALGRVARGNLRRAPEAVPA